MRTRGFFSPFRRLRWKLTFSYTLVTVAAVLALEVLGVIVLVLLLNYSSLPVTLVERASAQLAEQVRPFLDRTPPDYAGLSLWMEESFAVDSGEGSALQVESLGEEGEQIRFDPSGSDLGVVIGPAGEGLAANAPEVLSDLGSDRPFVDPLAPAESQRIIVRALAGEPSTLSLPNRTILTAQPIQDAEDVVLGVLYLRVVSLSPAISGSFLWNALQLLVISGAVFTLCAGAVGTLFGFITAHGLARRLGALTTAADAWGLGDFSVTARDTSSDEIGELARQLNRMAEQVENLLHSREQLATLEERNRLARDLHDSVKQQVFAATMTLGAAEALWDRDPTAARERMGEALALSRQAQQELTTLIRELRPAALEGKGLAAALREHVEDWSRQSSITVEMGVQGERPMSLEIEQALFRVTQEALANVVKHSEASRVTASLSCGSDTVTLIISDNGRGFDETAAKEKGLGLRSMRERVEALGGSLHVESDEEGTRVKASIPITGESA